MNSEKNSAGIQKNFFLISFLPAIAYWYLEENYPVRIAIMGGLGLAILEIIFERVFTKHIHSLSKFNFLLLLVLGGVSLAGDDGIWFKLQPAGTGIFVGGFFLFKVLSGKGMMWEMMENMNRQLPPYEVFKEMEIHTSFLFLLYGIFMAGIALKASTDTWLFFKTVGFYLVFGVFMVVEIILMRRRMKKYLENEMKKKVFKQF